MGNIEISFSDYLLLDRLTTPPPILLKVKELMGTKCLFGKRG
jgi:hypothetical protein